jgi:hypothetical protein
VAGWLLNSLCTQLHCWINAFKTLCITEKPWDWKGRPQDVPATEAVAQEGGKVDGDAADNSDDGDAADTSDDDTSVPEGDE